MPEMNHDSVVHEQVIRAVTQAVQRTQHLHRLEYWAPTVEVTEAYDILFGKTAGATIVTVLHDLARQGKIARSFSNRGSIWRLPNS